MSSRPPSESYPEHTPFHWTEQRSEAAIELAMGYSWQHTANKVGVIKKTIGNWLSHPDFAAEVDRLTLMVGISAKAERLRLCMRVIRQKTAEDGTIITKADVIDWVKLAAAELSGLGDLGLAAQQSEAILNSETPAIIPPPTTEPVNDSEVVN
jgi:hypothetical protein